MSTLYLLRHAKAGWALPGMCDFERPLDTTGIADAALMGRAMQVAGYTPELTLCSNARRCRQTLEGVAGQADTGRVLFLDELYTEDASGYLQLIRAHGEAACLLVIGHNPMTEDLSMALAGSGDANAREIMARGFPTSGLAVIRFDNGLQTAGPGDGYLEAFLTPADL